MPSYKSDVGLLTITPNKERKDCDKVNKGERRKEGYDKKVSKSEDRKMPQWIKNKKKKKIEK